MALKLDKIRPVKPRKFLRAYLETGSIKKAVIKSSVSRQCHYNWLYHDDDEQRTLYRDAFEECQTIVSSILEDEAWRRAVDGVDSPVVFRGEITGTYKEYSDSLLTLLLKANNPDKYKDRSQQDVTAHVIVDTKAAIAGRIDSIASKMGT